MSALNPDLPGAALHTGIDAAAQVIPGEDPGQLEALAADYHRQFQPVGPLERFLVDSLVYADWQLRRLRRAEAQLWHDQLRQARESYKGLNEAAPLGHVFERARDDFHYMQRRIDSTERSYFRSLKQLQRLQPPPREIPAPELASFRQPAPVAQIGFVPQPRIFSRARQPHTLVQQRPDFFQCTVQPLRGVQHTAEQVPFFAETADGVADVKLHRM